MGYQADLKERIEVELVYSLPYYYTLCKNTINNNRSAATFLK
jgi:hypothetical protein